MKQEIEIELTPLSFGAAFAEMDSIQQAETLAECWRQLRATCGGVVSTAMQCAEIREAMCADATRLIEELTEPAPLKPSGLLHEVAARHHQETMREALVGGAPSLPEIIELKRRMFESVGATATTLLIGEADWQLLIEMGEIPEETPIEGATLRGLKVRKWSGAAMVVTDGWRDVSGRCVGCREEVGAHARDCGLWKADRHPLLQDTATVQREYVIEDFLDSYQEVIRPPGQVERMRRVLDDLARAGFTELYHIVDLTTGGAPFSERAVVTLTMRGPSVGEHLLMAERSIGTVTEVDHEAGTVTVAMDLDGSRDNPQAILDAIQRRPAAVVDSWIYKGKTPEEEAKLRDLDSKGFVAHRVFPPSAGECDECRGTGWYQGLNKRERCSRGCE